MDVLNGVLVFLGLSLLIMAIQHRMRDHLYRYLLKRTERVLQSQCYQWDINVDEMVETMKPIWQYLDGH